jgi:hypothetical protein
MAVKEWLRKPAPPGDEPYARVKWVGPSSYTVLTVGSPPSGGDTISATQFGVNMIALVLGQASYDGRWMVIPVRISDAKWTLKWISLVTATVGGQSQTAFTEAVATTDLSSTYVKLQVNTVSA